EHVADDLVDAFSYLLCHQPMILAMNSSFVDPLLQFQSQMNLIESCFRTIFAIPNLDSVKKMGTGSEDTEDVENLYHNIFHLFEDTLIILISKDFYKLQILKEMVMWMNKDHFFLQERALLVISRVLNFSFKESEKINSVDAPCLGFLAADMCLLCFHGDPLIVKQASMGLYYILCIARCPNAHNTKTMYAKYSEHGSYSQTSTTEVELLPKILQQDKVKIALSVGQSPLPFFLTDFVWSLLKTLFRADYETALEAASMLQLTLEYHAQKVTVVSKILDDIHKELYVNESHIMKDAMMQIISLLTRASPKNVIFQLMDYPVPADNTLIMMWEAVSTESTVALQVLKTLLLILKGKPGDMEDTVLDKRRFSLDTTNMMPVMASQALCTFLAVKSYKKAVAQLFPQLLMALVLQLFYSSQLKMLSKEWPLFARDALRVLLNCSGLQEVDYALKKKNCWNKFSQTVYHRYGVYLIAKTLSDNNFPQFSQTLHYLHKISGDSSRRSEDSIITVILFTELLNNFFKDPFPEEFLVLYKNWVNDPNPEVSKLSLQKIGSMAPVINNTENICSLLMAVLDAFLSKEKTVVIRALLTLRRILVKLDKATYSSVCIKIASSYFPLMDHVNGGIRSMAIRHFGELLIDMKQYRLLLNSVVLGGLVPLILFLEDTETRVVQACRYTLEICDLELKWSISHLLKDGNYSFELVVLNICNNLLTHHETIITDLISDTLGFLGSSRDHLRRGALILIGYLAKLGENLLLKEEIEVMLEVAERVLRDKDPVIKQLTEKTCKIFKEISDNMSSSAIKQTSRRLLKFFSTKKLKPIYNWTSEESSYVKEKKELNIVQRLEEETEEDIQ
uniref:Maestro heat-like repeat family member 9 n=2 Tax=Jaculus jaculus TaxID=51337 RepID=A0A8C5L273_JACJA